MAVKFNLHLKVYYNYFKEDNLYYVLSLTLHSPLMLETKEKNITSLVK